LFLYQPLDKSPNPVTFFYYFEPLTVYWCCRIKKTSISKI